VEVPKPLNDASAPESQQEPANPEEEATKEEGKVAEVAHPKVEIAAKEREGPSESEVPVGESKEDTAVPKATQEKRSSVSAETPKKAAETKGKQPPFTTGTPPNKRGSTDGSQRRSLGGRVCIPLDPMNMWFLVPIWWGDVLIIVLSCIMSSRVIARQPISLDVAPTVGFLLIVSMHQAGKGPRQTFSLQHRYTSKLSSSRLLYCDAI